MKTKACFLAFTIVSGLLLICGSRVVAADEPAKVAGTWEMTVQGRRGTSTETLTIQQDGSTIKGTMKGERGERSFEGSVTGNKLSFTVKRETPNGTFTIEYTGTLDGDSLKGTFHSERFEGEWSAKRANAPSEK